MNLSSTFPFTFHRSPPILGQTENGRKTTQSTLKVLPELVIYDIDLTMSLPLGITLMSGFNAIAQAIEALYSKDNNPIIEQFAILGIQAMVKALPKLEQDLQEEEARSETCLVQDRCLYIVSCGTSRSG
jgi:maleylacetate reductase